MFGGLKKEWDIIPPNLPNCPLCPVFMRLDDREVGSSNLPKRSLRPPYIY